MRGALYRDEPKYLHLIAMLFAAVGFVYLFNLSQSHEPERHTAVLDQVRELARLDGMIGHFVLRAALGEDAAAPQAKAAGRDFESAFQALVEGPLAIAGRYGAQVDGALESYLRFHAERMASVEKLAAQAGAQHDLAGQALIAPAAEHNRALARSYQQAYDPIREQAKFYRLMMILEGVLALFYVGYFAIRLHRAKASLRQANIALTRSATELAAAVEEARQADLSKTAFLANMSHELRTPMNGVIGMAELLAATAVSDRQKSQAEVIVRSAGSLLTIINDILDFAKIEAGEISFDPEPFGLRGAVRDVMQLFVIPSQRKELRLSVRIHPDLPDRYVGDVGRFRQVVTNLVGNAVKFTEKGRVLIEVRSAAEIGLDGLLVLVADTGIGIAPEKRDEVFQKFRQVDNSVKRRNEGTGLGLAISKMLVERMGGRIGLSSRLGEGSIFWFSLPLPVQEAAPDRAEPATPEAAPQDLAA